MGGKYEEEDSLEFCVWRKVDLIKSGYFHFIFSFELDS